MAKPPVIPWVESSRDPWNVFVKVRQALFVLFPLSHRGFEENTMSINEK